MDVGYLGFDVLETVITMPVRAGYTIYWNLETCFFKEYEPFTKYYRCERMFVHCYVRNLLIITSWQEETAYH